MLVLRSGAVANRPGTEYVAAVKTSSLSTYLLKFVSSINDAYLLEFGNLYIRFFRQGAYVSVGTPPAWSSVTTYAIGDLVSNAGVNYYCIFGHINQLPPNASYWYALTSDILELPTPYLTADLSALQYAQAGDTLTIVSRNYAPMELRHTATRWTLSTVTTAPSIAAPIGTSGAAGTAGTLNYHYVVTALASETFEESLPSVDIPVVNCLAPT